MLCEALTFTALRDELPRLMAPGHTIMAPTNEAWAKMDESVRARIRGSCASFSSGTCALASPRCRIYGNDCAHCGPRFPPPPPICAETCTMLPCYHVTFRLREPISRHGPFTPYGLRVS